MRRKLGKPTPLLRPIATALLAVVALAAAGCGSSSEQFTSGESERALAALDSIESAVEDGRCETAQRLVNRLVAQAAHVNDDRPELGEAWAGSVARLSTLVLRDCVEISPTEPTGPVTADTGPTDDVKQPEQPEQPVTPSTPEPPADDGAGEQPNNGGGGQEEPDTTPPDHSGGAGPGT